MYYSLGEGLFPVLNMKADPPQNLKVCGDFLLLIHPEATPPPPGLLLVLWKQPKFGEQEVWSLLLLLLAMWPWTSCLPLVWNFIFF